MKGCIDFVASPAIQGWIGVGDGPLGKIEVWRKEKLVAEIEPNSGRADFADQAQRKGFRCVIPDGFSLEELATRDIKVVWRNGDHHINLEIWEPILAASHIVGMPDAKLARMVMSMKPQEVGRLVAIAEKTMNRTPHEKTEGQSYLRYGAISKDNVAIVGAGGHYFLYKGTNNLVDIYRKPKVADGVLSGWAEVIAQRSAWCAQHDAGYIQVFIPEKSSLTPKFVPYGISGPSAIWNGLLNQLSNNSKVLDCHRLLSNSFSPEGFFRKQDTHLSTYGAMQIAVAISENLTGHRIACRKVISKHLQFIGDLAKRFDGFPDELVEPLEVLDQVEINGSLALPPQLITSSDPAQGHIGIKRVWNNDSALLPQRAICFGNSFFERGGTSASLSWWLSRLFKEFHFVWSPNIDYDYVEHVKGDFVICQTTERFLERVPER